MEILSVPWPSNWLERLVSEMTYYVSSGTLNSTNSTQLPIDGKTMLGVNNGVRREIGAKRHLYT